MILTESERLAINMSPDSRTERVCNIYFKMKRCQDCNPHGKLEFRACWPHNEELVAIPKKVK